MRIRQAAAAAQIRTQNRELNGRISRYERPHKRLTDDDRLTKKPVTTKSYPRNCFFRTMKARPLQGGKSDRKIFFLPRPRLRGYGAAEAVSRFAFTLAI